MGSEMCIRDRYCGACIDGFGAALEQEQADGSMKPFAYISRASLDSGRRWTPHDLEADSIVWALKRLRGYNRGTTFRTFSDHKGLQIKEKFENHDARVQRWLEFFTAFDYILEYRKGSANDNADILSRLPEPATEHDRSGSTSLNRLEDGGIYLRRSCGLNTPSSSIPGVVLGGLVPRTERAVLGGLPFTSVDFRVCRTHGPRVRTFMLFREVSSLVFLPPSPPSIAVPVTGGLCLQPKTLSLRF